MTTLQAFVAVLLEAMLFFTFLMTLHQHKQIERLKREIERNREEIIRLHIMLNVTPNYGLINWVDEKTACNTEIIKYIIDTKPKGEQNNGNQENNEK